jgi:hypothetical protein
MRLTKETLSLDCKLTDKEFMDAASDLGTILQKVRRHEDSLAAYKKHIGAELAELAGKKNILIDKLATRMEKRPLVCEIKYDWDKKEKAWIRPDTKETVKTDIISEFDLQEHFDLENKKKGAGKKGKKSEKEKIQDNLKDKKKKVGEPKPKAPLLKCAVHGTVMSTDQCYRCWKKGEGDVNTKSRPECKKKNATVAGPDNEPPKQEPEKPEAKNE